MPEDLAFNRLDHVASTLFPQYSRSRLQTWIKNGELVVDGQKRKSKDKVTGGELVVIQSSAIETTYEAQAIPLNVVYEDEHLLVVNKPSGLVVHPGAGNFDGTLLNGWLHHAEQLNGIPRAGIVHRLDKDTSGLMVAAKNDRAHRGLAEHFSKHTVDRAYKAVVWGVPTFKSGVI